MIKKQENTKCYLMNLKKLKKIWNSYKKTKKKELSLDRCRKCKVKLMIVTEKFCNYHEELIKQDQKEILLKIK